MEEVYPLRYRNASRLIITTSWPKRASEAAFGLGFYGTIESHRPCLLDQYEDASHCNARIYVCTSGEAQCIAVSNVGNVVDNMGGAAGTCSVSR